jgi:hypothetical protein
MKITCIYIAAGVMMGLLLTVAAWAADRPMSQTPYAHGDEDKLPHGMIGVSLKGEAKRTGSPAALYAGMVHPKGPLTKPGSGMGMRS